MIKITELTHIYNSRDKARSVTGLEDVSLDIQEGEIVAVIGVSGSGKSTLLRCINKLLEPTSGDILINGESILKAPEHRARTIRRGIGMVFQNFNLLQRTKVIENVLMGRLGYISTARSLVRPYSPKDYDLALGCLHRVGIEDLAYRRVDTLSGGQQQRVGIARALAQKPSIILADEPVSNLDSSRKTEIMNLLKDIHRQDKITTLISLHDLDIARSYSSRIIGLVKGRVVFDGKPEELTDEKILAIFA